MADTFARMRQLIGTTAEWAANNRVLGNGEIGVERVSASDIRIKIGDGVTAWSGLPYASASSTTINAAVQAALDAKVAKAGDTMTGPLILSGDAAVALGAATKQQVDAAIAALQAALNGKMDFAGGTLTGPLTLSGNAVGNLQPPTKQQMDTADALKVAKSGDTMTGPLALSGDPTQPQEAANKNYVDNGAYQTVIGGTSTYAGKVVKLNAQGVLDQSLVPVSASYLGTVNMTLPYALTGTYRSGDYFATSATGTIDASWATRLNGAPTGVSAGQFLIMSANGKFDLVGDTASAAAINGKLDKAGGTMTGALVLAGNPTNPLDAVPKQYADLMLLKTGGTLTGPLTLSGNATAALQPVTKQQMDAALTAVLLPVNNLSDVPNKTTARTNLGATATGDAVFTAATPAAARTALGLGTSAVLDEMTAAEYRANVPNKVLTTDEVWKAAEPVGLTWVAGGTTQVDLSSGLNFNLNAAAGNTALGTPTNIKAGQVGFILIRQDATTARTLTFGAGWVFDAGVKPSLSTTPGALDVLVYEVLSATGPLVHGSLRKGLA